MLFKEIHIGDLIKERIEEVGIETSDLCTALRISENQLQSVLANPAIDTDTLLKVSKILDYDFFRCYSQHLILYAPLSAKKKTDKPKLPVFRKNIYTQEIIQFILEQLRTEKMSKTAVMERYNIPKTTLYKWISKYDHVVEQPNHLR